jgi:hypothetical protein
VSQCHASAATPWKELWYPSNRRLGGPQGLSGGFGKGKVLPLTGFEPQTVQPVASCSKDYDVFVNKSVIQPCTRPVGVII